MCTTTCGPLIKEVKYVASLQGVNVNNALTLENGILQWGGPLVENTIVSGPYSITLGTDLSRLTEFNVKASSKVLLEYSTGLTSAKIEITNDGIIVSDTLAPSKGITGAQDYQNNYTDKSYTQKLYVDTSIAGKKLSSALTNPGPGEDQFAIIWDNASGRFTLSAASAGSTPGTNTQVIFNNAGSLAGDARFIWDSAGLGNLTVSTLTLGGATYGSGETVINNSGTGASIDIRLAPKGDGNITLDIQSGGLVQIGANVGSFNVVALRAKGNDSTISIALEPKGTEGVVYIGNINEAGGYRYIQPRGSSSDISLQLRPKGAGEITIGDSSINATRHTLRAISASAGTILRLATKTSTFLEIDNSGVFIGNTLSPTLYFGTASDAVTSASISILSSTPNVSMFIYGKGTGRVYINGRSFIEIPIGNWNMDVDPSGPAIFHGLDSTKIKYIEVWIRDDANVGNYPINYTDTATNIVSGNVRHDNVQVYLNRSNGGVFNTASFSSTGFSRGTVTIWYEI